MKPKRLLNNAEAAEYLSISPKTLNTWRSNKLVEIPYLKLGGTIRYEITDLEDAIRANKRSPALGSEK